MGDVLSLIEKAEAEIDEEKAREMTQKEVKNTIMTERKSYDT